MGEKQCYTVVETKGYLKDLKKDADLNRYLPSIQKFVELLPENPFQKGVKKLEGRNDEYRQEFGRKRRLIFSIDKKLKIAAMRFVLTGSSKFYRGNNGRKTMLYCSGNERLFERFEKDADLNRYLPSIQKFVELLPENPFQKGVKNSKGETMSTDKNLGEKGG
ncbi:hypothetical protein CEXT_433171 [Caerostris extrusa]|uniref:Uncharacterized protein n=1 Tax=Caerostris extrusa TaxID=172846 RepID=A0AAV4QV98_CAEEX|nr:hypothetical protein CEXT_433171 [Caerostris extrusa]